jgi:thiamine biosynthesis lipoprotein
MLVGLSPDLVVTFRAMASDVTVRVVSPRSVATEAAARAQDVFSRVEQACTRFDPQSPLMRANADPEAWHAVPAELYDALVEASAAHAITEGLFDPRVLRVLESYGYDRSLPFEAGPVDVPGAPAVAGRGRHRRPSQEGRAPWQPWFDEPSRSVRIGADPVDLGGIGKGLAVRWALAALAGAGRSALVEAGGDCAVLGEGPDGDGWKVGVQDPSGGDEPVAVLAVTDLACATSSVRVRRWRAGGRDVHHLIDPRTGAPGGEGLASVTVVGPDPALAEVWSKSLFLAGAEGVAAVADEQALAALWVGEDGSLGTSALLDPFVVWRRDGA